MNPYRLAAAGGGGGDPYFDDVYLLSHMDGADGSTVFTDSGPLNTAITNSNSVQKSTSQYKYGVASAQFTGVYNKYLTVPSPAFGTSDFTIEISVYMAVTPTGERKLFMVGGTSSDYSNIRIYVNAAMKVGFYVRVAGGTFYYYEHATALSLGTWYQLAIIRYGNTILSFVDGALVKTQGIPATDFYNTGPVYIGTGVSESDSFIGYLDEFRITKGIARYTASYVAPTAAFPDSL